MLPSLTYEEKAYGILLYLPPPMFDAGLNLVDGFLAGSTINTLAQNYKDGTPPDRQNLLLKGYDFYKFELNLSPAVLNSIMDTALKILNVFQSAIQVSGPDFYQARGKIEELNINITWTLLSPYDFLLCSNQCLYHVFKQTLLWKDLHHYKLFCNKILDYSDWNNLFVILSYSLRQDKLLARWAQKRINFLFKLYTRHIAEGWKLSASDRFILEDYFKKKTWRQFLTISFQQEMRRKGKIKADEEIDLVALLKLNLYQYNPRQVIPSSQETQNAKMSEPPKVPGTSLIECEPHKVRNTSLIESKPPEVQDRSLIESEPPKVQDTTTIERSLDQDPPLPWFPSEEKEEEAKKVFLAAQSLLKKSEKNLEALNDHMSWLKTQEKGKASSASHSRIKPIRSSRTVWLNNRRRGVQKKEGEQDFPLREKKQLSLWNKVQNWVNENPLLFITGILTFGFGTFYIINQLMKKSTSVAEEKIDSCSDHYIPMLGNANMKNASLLVMVQHNSNSSRVNSCFNEFFKKFPIQTVLYENVPIASNVPCNRTLCHGWDFLSPTRAFLNKRDFYEASAYKYYLKFFKQNEGLPNSFRYKLWNFESTLQKTKSDLERDNDYHEDSAELIIDYVNPKAQDYYRDTLIMIRHAKFLLKDKKIENLNILLEEYKKEFTPIVKEYEPNNELELKMRMESMHKAIKKYVHYDLKVAMLATYKVFLPYHKKYLEGATQPSFVAYAERDLLQKLT